MVENKQYTIKSKVAFFQNNINLSGEIKMYSQFSGYKIMINYF